MKKEALEYLLITFSEMEELERKRNIHALRDTISVMKEYKFNSSSLVDSKEFYFYKIIYNKHYPDSYSHYEEFVEHTTAYKGNVHIFTLVA